jgi:hypothetical protein
MKQWFPLSIVVLLLSVVAVAQTEIGGRSNASTGSGQSTATQTSPDKPAATQTTPDAAGKSAAEQGLDSADPLLDAPPLPANAKPTLIGGIATSVDRVRNRVTLQPFGAGKKVKLHFDERSHIYRDGRESTILAINKGDRVYADTILVGPDVFATKLRVQSSSGPAEARGQIQAVDGDMLEVRDQLSGQVVTVNLPDDAKIKRKKGNASRDDLKPGALVAMTFTPVSREENTIREMEILASPGDSYQFFGKVTHLDLSRGFIAIDNQSDGRSYEVRFDPAMAGNARRLNVGTQVNTVAVFDGQAYNARSLEVSDPPATAEE